MISGLKIAFRTFGCKLNQFETAGMHELLQRSGSRIVDFSEEADVYIINTCTVTARTDRRSRQAVRQAHQTNPNARIIVTGCGAQRDFSEFAGLPAVRVIIGNGEKNRIVRYVRKLIESEDSIYDVSDIMTAPFERIPITQFGDYSRAFVKIQDGCSRACSYCVIPSVRGPSRSQNQETVFSDIQRLIENGFREIVLTGIDLGAYGLDLEPITNLVNLLNVLESFEKLTRIRLSSIEPMEMTQALIEKITGSRRVCRHFHIPMQSGSNRILRLMNRTYSREDCRHIIQSIKDRSPDACIGTDVIVGFPGESDCDFSETFHFLSELPINHLHVFSYSVRPGTPAARLPDLNPPQVIKDRSNTLRTLGFQKGIAFRRRLVGTELPVIVLGETDKPTGSHVTLSDNYIRILISGVVPPKGEIVTVRLDSCEGFVCHGSIV